MNHSKTIFITDHNFRELIPFTRSLYTSLFVLVDENTLKHCYPSVQNILPAHQLIVIPSGELNKTLATCQSVWDKLTENNADRKSLLLNLGGGVITDLGGFCAACYKRGIAFINLPTSLLAMVDASVGGKTGVDYLGFKNQIGIFKEPQAVFVHPGFLTSLPRRELLSGFAEVIKHFLIADAQAFKDIQTSKPGLNHIDWSLMVEKNIKIKSAIVEQDPEEKGIRKALNVGQTMGHAIESLLLESPGRFLLHGEAVAAGMLAESFLSFKKELLTRQELTDIEDLILHYYKLPALESTEANTILRLIKQDKKNERNTAQFTLLQHIGNYSINQPVEEGQIIESLNYYNSLLK